MQAFSIFTVTINTNIVTSSLVTCMNWLFFKYNYCKFSLFFSCGSTR